MICSPIFLVFLFLGTMILQWYNLEKEKRKRMRQRGKDLENIAAAGAACERQQPAPRRAWLLLHFSFFRYGAATTWGCPKFCKIGRNAWMWEWACFVLRSCSSKNRPFLWIMLRLMSLSSFGATYYKGDLANAAKDSERKRAYLPKYSEWRSNWREV